MFVLRGDQRNIARQNAAQPLYVVGGLSTAEAAALACGAPDDHDPLAHDALLRAALASGNGAFMRSLDVSCCPALPHHPHHPHSHHALHLPLFERPYLVYAWLVNLITRRAYAGATTVSAASGGAQQHPHPSAVPTRGPGLAVEAPVLARVYQLLSDGLAQGYEGARRVTDTPFPFPWAQTMLVLLLAFTAYCPLLIASYVSNVALATTLSIASTVAYWTMNEVARELEDAFAGENALPTAMMQFCFNEALLRAAAFGCAAPVAVPGAVGTGAGAAAAAVPAAVPAAAAAAAAPTPFAAAAGAAWPRGQRQASGSAAPPPTPSQQGHQQGQQPSLPPRHPQPPPPPPPPEPAWLVERLRAKLGGRPPSVAEVEAAEIAAMRGGGGGGPSAPAGPAPAAAAAAAPSSGAASQALPQRPPSPAARRPPSFSTSLPPLPEPMAGGGGAASSPRSPLMRKLQSMVSGGLGGGGGRTAQEQGQQQRGRRQQLAGESDGQGGGNDSDASGSARVHSMLPPLRISSFGALGDAIRSGRGGGASVGAPLGSAAVERPEDDDDDDDEEEGKRARDGAEEQQR